MPSPRAVPSYQACLWSVLLWSIVSPLHAAAGPNTQIPPKLKGLDSKQICPIPGGPASRYLLARAIIDSYKIPISLVDWENTGTIGHGEFARTVSKYLCHDVVSGADTNADHIKKCVALSDKEKPTIGVGKLPPLTADAVNQGGMVSDIKDVLNQAAAGNAEDFKLTLGKLNLMFHRDHKASPLDAQQQSLLIEDGELSLAAEVFSEAPVYYVISCPAAAPEQPAPPAVPGQSGTGGPSSAASPILSSDRFRIRAKPEDLPVGRDQETFAGLSTASFAIQNDVIAQKNSFDVHGVLGYALTTWQLGAGDTTLSTIPFAQYDRSYVDGGKAPPNSSNVNNLAFGLQERLVFPFSSDFYNSVVVQPKYVEGLASNARVFQLHLGYEPAPLLPYFAAPAPIGPTDFSATVYARGILNIVHVDSVGSDKTLLGPAANFSQGGVELGASLFDKQESSLLNGLTFPVTYTYLNGFSGPYKAVHLFQAQANYVLPKTKYVSISLSYLNGRNLDTFQQQKVYKASLGLKY
jgi:hypothetical protein